MTDKPINLGDESQVKERAKKEKVQYDRELDDLKLILSTKSGRRFIWRLLAESGMFTVSQAMNASIYFLEGKRSIGKLLFEDMTKVSPEAWALMLKESKEP